MADPAVGLEQKRTPISHEKGRSHERVHYAPIWWRAASTIELVQGITARNDLTKFEKNLWEGFQCPAEVMQGTLRKKFGKNLFFTISQTWHISYV